MDRQKPTIKGIFVNSHIRTVHTVLGDDGVSRLEKLYGHPITFNNGDDVPLREEIAIIEFALDLLSSAPIPKEQRSFEAGRLHFRNFSMTPLGQILFSMFRNQFKLMMLHANNIAGHVFRNVEFSSRELGDKSVEVTMENNDYPLDHFRGLFYEWMIYSGHTGSVSAEKLDNTTYRYTMTWK
jgi:uncharacterized protein (TIGR02265 family)